VLWRDTAGTVVDWTMNGSQVTSEHTVATVDPSWQVAQIGDFNGDGKADVLWRSTLSGAMQDWTMNGSTIASNDPVAQGSTLVDPATATGLHFPIQPTSWYKSAQGLAPLRARRKLSFSPREPYRSGSIFDRRAGSVKTKVRWHHVRHPVRSENAK
jgi:hypothetical protein